MIIKKAEFINSNTTYKQCPKANKPEYAFIGRSNVGKSSLINSIVNNKKLAKTSSTPGKTRLINHFLINDQWYLVDLPGYGFAKASKSDRNVWSGYIKGYILNRENLMLLFVLIDSRLSPQKIDLEFIEQLGIHKIPFTIVFTKIDKISKAQLEKNIEKFSFEMLKQWEQLPMFFVTSSKLKTGNEALLDLIEKTNSDFIFEEVKTISE